MKKNYIQPNILVEKIDSYDIITESSDPTVIIDPQNPASGKDPVLSPRRKGIWDNEY